MAQHDYSIANQTAANLRTDLNNVLLAIVSNNSGATEPADTFANMFWYDTTNNVLKMRNEADDVWVNIGYVDPTTNAFRVFIFDDTQVINLSGTQTGLLGDQATATWETGTGTTESLVSPAKVKAAIDANVTTAKVNAAIASSTLSAVGTYAFLGASGVTMIPGGAYLGSTLQHISVGGDTNESNDFLGILSGTAVPGTWLCMGFVANTGVPTGSLFLRIS